MNGIGRWLARTAWTGWGISFVVHLGLLLTLALLIGTLQGGARSTLVVQVRQSTPIPSPEQLPEAADLWQVEAVKLRGSQPVDLDLLTAPDPPQLVEPGGRGDNQPQPPSEPQEYGGPRGQHAQFFGATAYGDRFVYILDMSGSMGQMGRSSGEGTRFHRAAAGLMHSVEQLRPEQSFYVLLFAVQTRPMFDDPTPRLMAATAENKQRLRKWLSSIYPSGNTDPRLSLRIALRLDPSAIFLLSDGEFNGQQRGLNVAYLGGNPSVEELVNLENPGKIPIHTFAFEDRTNRDRLQALASSTNGEFRFIAAPGRRAVLESRSEAATDTDRAEAWLRNADLLEQQGRFTAARYRYQRITREYPNTVAADQAAKRLEQLPSE